MTIDELELFFVDDSNQEEYSAAGISQELKEGGSSISVTEENKLEYLQRFAKHRLVGAIKPQVAAFRDGLRVVVDESIQERLCKCCTVIDLQLLMCGTPTIDVADWQRETEYSNCNASSDVVVWFW